MKKGLKYTAKVLIFILCFTVIFSLLQNLLVPKFFDDSTTIVNNFYALKNDSIDVLFLGSSQMFCAIDDGLLKDEFNVNAYDFGASAQQLTQTEYYLEEALKTQHPKRVMVEVCGIFNENTPDSDSGMAWTYAPTKLSVEKVKSIYVYSGNDLKKTVFYSFPLLQFHSRWNEITKDEIVSSFFYKPGVKTVGFTRRDNIEKADIKYLGDYDGDIREIPDDSITAIKNISDICAENGITLSFFKAPVSIWTRNDSKSVKEFMKNNGYEFTDLNDYIEEIKIDPNKDFLNEAHLNYTGAEKTTKFLAEHFLKEYFR